MATTFDINLTQGTNFSALVVIKDSNGVPVNLSGFSARGIAKHRYGDVSSLLNLNPQVISGSSPTYPALVSGLISIDLTAAQTAALPVMVGVYDIERYTTGDADVTKILQGKVIVSPEVTI